MREAFRKALGEEFLSKGGREILVRAKLEDSATSFSTAEQLLQIVTAASQREVSPDIISLLTELSVRKAKVETAEDTGPVGPNSMPRMLKVTAFIAHGGGLPNRNGDAFIDEDLRAAVDKGLFAAPYFGMIDHNHDFNAYGVWYNSRFALDPETQTNGILAEGAVFAWRYTDLADRMLAQQQRQGHMDVSMGCIAQGVEMRKTADGQQFTVIRQPIFFTTSLLTVPPADEKARGMGTEDPEKMHDLMRDLMGAEQKTAKNASHPHLSNVDITNTAEVAMTIEDLVEAFRKVVAEENKAQFDEIVAAALKLPTVQAALDEVTNKVTALEQLKVSNEQALTESATKVAELETVKASLEGKLTEQNTELEALRTFKAEIDAKAEAEAKTAKWTGRLAELTETARKAFDTREDEVKARLQERWTNYDQEEWEIVRDSLNAAKFELKSHYESLSDKEGNLAPGTSEKKESKDKIDAFLPSR